MSKTDKPKYLLYKGKPLVRKDRIIYYGNMSDKYVVMMEILENEKNGELDVATKVNIELQYTDPDLKNKDRVLKKSQKKGLYNALDIGAVWLERALNDK